MWTPFSTPSPRRARRDRTWPGRFALALAAGLAVCGPAAGQVVVVDPTNHATNLLQAARQLESLANEARSLAASPYSHLAENAQALRDMGALAQTARGLAGSIDGLERQFRTLYPDDLSGADLERLLGQGRDRAETARRTAEDLARTAAELERLGRSRPGRLGGALAASEAASGQTAAVQSATQMLAVLAEELAALRTLMLAQSRLMAETAAREAADRAAGDAARRGRWSGAATAPPAPRFDPLPNARD